MESATVTIEKTAEAAGLAEVFSNNVIR